jgi:hypothetical protein
MQGASAVQVSVPLRLTPVVQGVGVRFDLLATLPHFERRLERLVDLLLHLAQVGLVPLQDEGFEHIRRGFRLCPHSAEFKSKTKARAIANGTDNADPA